MQQAAPGIVDNALRDESRSASFAAPVRGCLAKRSVREQNTKNMPGMRNKFSTLF
jgi:hypothetical protein